MKLLKFIPLFFLVFACSKKSSDSVTPSTEVTAATLVGTWNLESTSGSITEDGQKESWSKYSEDFSVLASPSITFKADGTAVQSDYTESVLKYTVKDNVLTLIDPESNDLSITTKVSLSNNKLVLKSTKTEFATLIALSNAFGAKITDWNETVTYVKK